jgi:hypothetical protein
VAPRRHGKVLQTAGFGSSLAPGPSGRPESPQPREIASVSSGIARFLHGNRHRSVQASD